MKKKYLASMILLGSIALFGLQGHKAEAASLKATAKVNAGEVNTADILLGATYYTVSDGANGWRDMKDTYKDATIVPDAASQNTVYFYITSDVLGSMEAYTTNWQNGQIIEGRSLYIDANNKTLYLDNDTNYKTGPVTAGEWAYAPFSTWGQTITPATTLTLANANVVNNINGGLFHITQNNGGIAAATIVNKNVNQVNGAPTSDAKPFQNTSGKIVLQGTNNYTIYQNNTFGTTNNVNDGSGINNHGEWIQGGGELEVQSGTTTLNYSWGNDQPMYNPYSNNNKLTIDDNAKMIWNLNQSWTMYWGVGQAMDVNWNIGKNAVFQINGTVNTFKYDGNWFASGNYQAFNFNIDQGGKFLATTGGGAINLNSFSQPVKWTFNKDSQLLFNSMSSSTLLNNPKVSGSSLTLNDPAVVTFNASNANVINGTLSNFPVTINGTGLRTHASATGTTFDSTFDMNKPNRDDIVPNTSDTWYFNNIGTINNLGGSITTPGFAFPYSAADITKINAAKYLSWYKPLGTQIYGYKSNMSRTFNVGLGNLPADGSFSPSISGNAVQNIVVADDRNPKPNFAITLSMVQNNIPDKLNFTWTDPTTSTETPLVLNTSQQIIGTDTNGNLSPAPKSTANAGMNYTFEFATDKGLKVQAKNNLKVQANTNAGTFKYSINSGV